MANLNIQSLGPRIIEKRGRRGVRDVAKEVGVSPATLSRIENGHVPDLDTFQKVCIWLGIDPGDVLGISKEKAVAQPITVHFKKEKTTDPELATALAKMILAADRALAYQDKSIGS